jgi:hypothetical protein
MPEEFKGKDFIIALVRAFANEVQDIEDADFPMLSLLDIDTMIGAQLDGIGDILTEPRAGQNDANYRVALKAKAARITASGTPEQIIERFITLTGSTPPVDFFEDFPAGYGIYGDAASYPSDILTSMEAASAVGVYVAIFQRLTKEGSSDLITTEGGDAIYTRYRSSGR